MKVDNRVTALIVAVLGIVVLAGAWFLGASPQLDAAAQSASQADQLSTSNVALTAQVAQLRRQQATSGDLTAKLATLEQSIPSAADTTEFLQQVSTVAGQTGVSVTQFTPAGPVAYAPPTTAPGAAPSAAPAPAATPTPTAAATTSAAATPEDGSSPVQRPTVTAQNFVVQAVSITAAGSEGQVMAFLDALRSMPRLYLITSVSKQAPTDGSQKWELSVQGNIYTLTAATTAAAPSATPTPSASASASGK